MRRFWLVLIVLVLLPGAGTGAPKGKKSSKKKRSSKKGCPQGMSLISGGWFYRGSSRGPLDERPRRKIWISSFCLDQTEVSMGAYLRCVRAKACRTPRPPRRAYGKNRPAIGVDWYDAVAYCRWAKKRLPHEAEWEKAARGGRRRARYPFWGPLRCSTVSYGASRRQPCRGKHPGIPLPVRSLRPGPYRLYHMAGNVGEWVADCYAPFYYRKSPKRNPVLRRCSSAAARVIRGGALSSPADGLRLTARKAAWPKGTHSDIGFRCARSVH